MLLSFPSTGQDLYLVEESTGVLWFKAADVCAILGFSNPTAAISNHCPDDSKTIDYQPGRGRAALFISEPGVYLLAMESKSPIATKFKQWVARDVLPAVRRAGAFNDTPNAQSEASEFWQLIDGAIARNLNPKDLIDWHQQFNGKNPSRGKPVKTKNSKPQRAIVAANSKPTASIEEIGSILATMASTHPEGITPRQASRKTRKISGSSHAKQMFSELAAIGIGTIGEDGNYHPFSPRSLVPRS